MQVLAQFFNTPRPGGTPLLLDGNSLHKFPLKKGDTGGCDFGCGPATLR